MNARWVESCSGRLGACAEGELNVMFFSYIVIPMNEQIYQLDAPTASVTQLQLDHVPVSRFRHSHPICGN